MTSVRDAVIKDMQDTLREIEDRAFFGDGSGDYWGAKDIPGVASHDLLESFATFLRRKRMTPWERRADEIAGSYASMMRREGFDPDKGDWCFVDIKLTLFWTKLTRQHLPKWLREAPFNLGEEVGAYFVKRNHDLDFFHASLKE